MLFSRIQQALDSNVEVFFEPDRPEQFREISTRSIHTDTLTKVLIGRVMPDDKVLAEFDKHVVIYRDPRDQFVSTLLYLFYDFQVSGDQLGFDRCFNSLQKKQQEPAKFSAVELYNEVAVCVGRAPIAVFNNLHRVQAEYIKAFSPYRARYEELLNGEWAALGKYLGLTLTQEAQVPQEYCRVTRSKGYGDWQLWLNADDVDYTNNQWGETISALGYALGEAPRNQVISEKTTLEYVKQFDPRRNPPL